MKPEPRVARVGLVVLKFRRAQRFVYLMRVNPTWKDVTFIGGHEKPRDRGDLAVTARRELWEEVPGLRTDKTLEVEPISDIISYGPIWSKSRHVKTIYSVQYFLLCSLANPGYLVRSIGKRSMNVWIEQDILSFRRSVTPSGFVFLLNKVHEGGLDGIPCTSCIDIAQFEPENGMSGKHFVF